MKNRSEQGIFIIERDRGGLFFIIAAIAILLIRARTRPMKVPPRLYANYRERRAALSFTHGAFEHWINCLPTPSLTIPWQRNKSGAFIATPDATSPDLQFTCDGTPQISTATANGTRFYFADESQVVRFNLSGAATSGSSGVGN